MKRILLTVSIFLTAAVAFGYYLFNKPHSSIVDETPIALSEAPALVGEYEADENSANAKYLGKVIEVTGTISDKNLDEKGSLRADDELPVVVVGAFRALRPALRPHDLARGGHLPHR